MDTHPILFPTFYKWYQSLSRLLVTTPTPIRIALFPTLLIIASFPIAILAFFSETRILPRAYVSTLPSPNSSITAPETPDQASETNLSPRLITTSLPSVIRDQFYLTNIIASDPNLSDNLTIKIANLPQGLKADPCRPTQTLNQLRIISCSISGVSHAPATVYPVTITVTDSHQAISTLTLPLEISR